MRTDCDPGEFCGRDGRAGLRRRGAESKYVALLAGFAMLYNSTEQPRLQD